MYEYTSTMHIHTCVYIYIYIYMHLHTHDCMPAASMPAVAWVRDRTGAKPLLPPAAMPAAALPAAAMKACVCRCLYMYMYTYMGWYGVLKSSMGFSPKFDFCSASQFWSKNHPGWCESVPEALQKPKAPCRYTFVHTSLLCMFITIAYWKHGLVLLLRGFAVTGTK